MKASPILFSTPMVQAIVAWYKSMTRRVIPQNIIDRFQIDEHGILVGSYREGMPEPYPTIDDANYQADDILWVRETWRVGAWNEETQCIAVDYKEGAIRKEWIRVPDRARFLRYVRQSVADAEKAGQTTVWEPGTAPTRWRSARFMPREVARIFLRVTAVRAERIQDITSDDARDEGVDISTGTPWPFSVARDCHGAGMGLTRYQAVFVILWDSLNAKRGYPWSSNPWVWVYNFERCEKPEGWPEHD